MNEIERLLADKERLERQLRLGWSYTQRKWLETQLKWVQMDLLELLNLA